MVDDIRIERASDTGDMDAVAALFRGYAASLPVDLDYQGFDEELAALPGKYAVPRGALLLARDASGAALACVGLRPLDAEGLCEMKRLYLLPAARGTGLGRALAEAVVAEARGLGYCELRLDTLPSMARAIAMYTAMGFERIAAYYAPTPPGTVFMALKL
ncbi:GNAT family N-acetyltransferase [Sphingomonas psychrotolerans]|uniref:GNAT family N-acetyltransferase n=1 Tax=Sphingomonas psychrotolerans TaxID=1327635 RepID=A0ABU3N414_9SPHN|nr:GNAT family N-acetyltransferase [Sphingomonas psychrotolerans]MDT8758522.1 GNAT family N-acetyltransferase [Sphingomonas psychrotolerans]